MLSGRLFPYHSKPQPDELLSSWLIRTAWGHGQKPHPFCQTVWPRKQIWPRDIDSFGSADLVADMAGKTATPLADALATTLSAYEGDLVSSFFALGRTKWVLRLGIFHRTRRHGGLQYCPRCLENDPDPYFRRLWRLAFAVCCTRHALVLRDSCPACETPLAPHRATAIYLCHECGADLRTAPAEQASLPALELQQQCEVFLNQGWASWGNATFVRSFLFLDMLHQALRVLASGPRSAALRMAVASHWGGDPQPPAFETSPKEIEILDTVTRHRLLDLAARLLEHWPNRFVKACVEARVWHSWAMRDFHEPPYEYERVVKEHLYRPSYKCSEIELQCAERYLVSTGQRVSQNALRELLGDSRLISRSIRRH